MDDLGRALVAASAYLQTDNMSWDVGDDSVNITIYTSIGTFACSIDSNLLTRTEEPTVAFVHYDHLDERRGEFFLIWDHEFDSDSTITIRPHLIEVSNEVPVGGFP